VKAPVRLPIFPLPSVVLFPGCLAPLHVFEPRYRQMTADVLEGDRRIGMVTVRPEAVHLMEGDPPVYEVGCAGFIARHEQLADGRYHLVLHGTQRFRIERQEPPADGRLYRIAEVAELEDPPGLDEGRSAKLRKEVVARLRQIARRSGSGELGELPFERLEILDHASFANTLCQAIGFPTPEKQGLLEAGDVAERLARLEGLLAFHLASMSGPHQPGGRDTVH